MSNPDFDRLLSDYREHERVCRQCRALPIGPEHPEMQMCLDGQSKLAALSIMAIRMKGIEVDR